MTARKSERIMNLTICLLMARRFLPKEHIREVVEGYFEMSDRTFERTFERDKDELRRLGIPIEVGSNDALFPDEVGYRIRRTDFELPPISFDAAETAVLAVAASVWEQARRAGQTTRAVAKLRAAGIEPDASRTETWAASMDAPEPAFEPLWDAYLAGQRVRFKYRDVDRHVEPWHLANRRGDWFLIGFDLTRGDSRSFKLSRIQDEPRPDPEGAPIDRPQWAVVQTHLDALEPNPKETRAVLALRDGAAAGLRRHAEVLPDLPAPPGFTSYQVLLAGDAVGEVASMGDDVIVLEPPDLVADVRQRWEEVASQWL